jgi:hypothetical protein
MANGVPDEMLLVGPFVLFVFLVCALPCYQVFCLIVTVAIYAIWPRLDRGYQLIQLAKIGGGIVVGTVAGLLAMLLLIVPFVVLR